MAEFYLTSGNSDFAKEAKTVLSTIKNGDTVYVDDWKEAPTVKSLLDAAKVDAKIFPSAQSPKFEYAPACPGYAL